MKPWGRDDLSPKWEVHLVSPPFMETGLGLDFGVKEEAPAFWLCEGLIQGHPTDSLCTQGCAL